MRHRDPPVHAGIVAPVARVQWQCLPFAEVPPLLLYRALGLRSQVFVVEQRCIYQDIDGIDPRASMVIGVSGRAHLPGIDTGNDVDADRGVGRDADSDSDAQVVATARLLPPGLRFEEASIGRVCTSPVHRRQGLGRLLMDYSISCVRQHHPGHAIRISAQAYLQQFYESLGFEVVSPPYLEDDIPHLEMRLEASLHVASQPVQSATNPPG
jgi:ElaA protein